MIIYVNKPLYLHCFTKRNTMDKDLRKQIIELLHQEIVPAVGCTEPVAVALAVSKAAEVLGTEPEEINVLLSANMLKNAMGVGIPGTGMIGLPIAISLGAVIAKPELKLEVLSSPTEKQLIHAKELVKQKIINIALKEGDIDKLYVEVQAKAAGNNVKVILEKSHANIPYVEYNGKVLLNNRQQDHGVEDDAQDNLPLNFKMVYDFAMTAPLEEIEFIEDAAKLNLKASEFARSNKYGHETSHVIQSERGLKYLGNSAYTRMLAMTSGACDGRMGGAPIPVISNSGSGNQGLAATLPVISFSREVECSREQYIRSLLLSSLMVIYIKQHLGRLSALCGCVVASIGSSCGITYLMGGSEEQIVYCIKNMIGNITGMICDGAKPSCALKVSSGVSSAMFSALLAMENKVVSSQEGIIEDDVDRCIINLTSIGSQGMNLTDKLVLDIMTHKE